MQSCWKGKRIAKWVTIFCCPNPFIALDLGLLESSSPSSCSLLSHIYSQHILYVLEGPLFFFCWQVSGSSGQRDVSRVYIVRGGFRQISDLHLCATFYGPFWHGCGIKILWSVSITIRILQQGFTLWFTFLVIWAKMSVINPLPITRNVISATHCWWLWCTSCFLWKMLIICHWCLRWWWFNPQRSCPYRSFAALPAWERFMTMSSIPLCSKKCLHCPLGIGIISHVVAATVHCRRVTAEADPCTTSKEDVQSSQWIARIVWPTEVGFRGWLGDNLIMSCDLCRIKCKWSWDRDESLRWTL